MNKPGFKFELLHVAYFLSRHQTTAEPDNRTHKGRGSEAHVASLDGISDVEFIAADRLNSQAEDSIDAARARIAELVHLENRAA